MAVGRSGAVTRRTERSRCASHLLDVVGRIAEQHETTHSAVSLAWLLARPQTSSIIVGARTEAQLEDNLRALSVKLTSEDLKELDEASRPDWDYPWDVIRDAEATRSSWLDEPHWTSRRGCRAPGAASDFVKAGLTDERK